MDQCAKQNILCTALMARKCGIMDIPIYSAPAKTYFTHQAAVDNFMPLSPEVTLPANQCPLKRLECSFVTGSSLHYYCSAQILAPTTALHGQCALQEASIGRCSLRWYADLQWLHSSLIMNRTFLLHGCQRQFFKPLFIQPRFANHSEFFSSLTLLIFTASQRASVNCKY